MPDERLGSMRFIVAHRKLLLRVIGAEVRSRYAGAHLGAAWVLLAPALLLSVYALIYVEIFKVEVATLDDQLLATVHEAVTAG